MTASAAPVLRILSIDFYERQVRLRMPFRFGVVTLTHAPQVFARVQVQLADGRQAWGASAELLAPKWFDKNPQLSNEQNFDQLRQALLLARELYLEGGARTAFAHFEQHHLPQQDAAAAQGLNPLVAHYGPALIDRAVIDALCRALKLDFFTAMQRNATGIQATPLCPDLQGFDLDRFLAALRPAAHIAARHTVGMVDAITSDDVQQRVGDGLPQTLEEVVAHYGQRWFKLKVGGDLPSDLQRLQQIAAVLDRIEGGYQASLDGNEQYDEVADVLALWQAMQSTPALAQLCRSVVFIEQPIKRQSALRAHVGALAAYKPVIIDESDDSLDAFVRARQMGYSGVSSKTCKGIYKSVLNRARCAQWNLEAGLDDGGLSNLGAPGVGYFMSAEDLTIQAGLALQQDLALVSLLGIAHVERNGHHYVNGMADLPEAEQQAFFAAHPDLYERSHGAVRLRIEQGQIALGSLACPGFASAAQPLWTAMQPMPLRA